jgi:hypothetical protein
MNDLLFIPSYKWYKIGWKKKPGHQVQNLATISARGIEEWEEAICL